MKVRQRKRIILARMAFNHWLKHVMDAHMARLNAQIEAALALTPEEKAKRDAWFDNFWDELLQKQAVRCLVEPTGEEFVVVDDLSGAIEAAKQEFVVAKKSTGEVVGTFDLRDDAEALIEKHKRQKKAALVLLDTAA